MLQSNTKPTFSLRLGKSLSLGTISQHFNTIGPAHIQGMIESALLEHSARFGHQPFHISYDRASRGYIIQAASSIGIIDCGLFFLKLEPKFSGLEIGKCLQLAHYCRHGALVKHSNSVVEENVSTAEHLDGIDYFSAAFLSSVIDVVNNGLLKVTGNQEGPDSNCRGSLMLDRHLSKGGSPLAPYMRRQVPSDDLPVNRTLKAAINLCRLHSKSSRLKAIATAQLNAFSGVADVGASEEYTFSFETSLRRSDYQKALNFARIILEGFDPNSGGDSGFVPSFTIDLDSLFEEFVSTQLSESLTAKYSVMLQKSFPHPTDPVISNISIVPDVVVSAADERSRSVVLDTKNKYSLLSDDVTLSISNADLYQVAYYCLATNSEIAILVYPGNERTRTKYPIKSAEGDAAYEKKRLRALERMANNAASAFRINFSGQTIRVYVWRINLQGTMHETLSSVAELSLFLTDAIKGRI